MQEHTDEREPNESEGRRAGSGADWGPTRGTPLSRRAQFARPRSGESLNLAGLARLPTLPAHGIYTSYHRTGHLPCAGNGKQGARVVTPGHSPSTSHALPRGTAEERARTPAQVAALTAEAARGASAHAQPPAHRPRDRGPCPSLASASEDSAGRRRLIAAPPAPPTKSGAWAGAAQEEGAKAYRVTLAGPRRCNQSAASASRCLKFTSPRAGAKVLTLDAFLKPRFRGTSRSSSKGVRAPSSPALILRLNQ